MERNLFKQIPIKCDNACFYRSCCYYLYLFSDENKDPEEIIKIGPGTDKTRNIVTRNMINDNRLPQLLQKNICDWVYKNYDSQIEELGYSVVDLLIDTHYSHLTDNDSINKMDILDDYRDRYSVFAADKNDEIDERWGGSLDMYVLTQLYNIGIKIYIENNSKKYQLIQQFGKDNKLCISLLYKDGIHYVVLLPKEIQK
jgi:hypothetical protein